MQQQYMAEIPEYFNCKEEVKSIQSCYKRNEVPF